MSAASTHDQRTASVRCPVVVHLDPDTLALATATYVVAEARRAVKASGRFAVALAGGSTPKHAYQLLAQPPLAGLMPWEADHVFWGDERCVDPTDPRSNERMAREALLDHVPVPPDQVHPMRCRGGGNSGSPLGESRYGSIARGAAEEYERVLRAFFPMAGSMSAAGRIETTFDLVLLGLGDNGHTASLFPGSAVLDEGKRWVAATFVDAAAGSGTTAAGQDLWRLTLTAPFINQAASVVFLVSGPAKAAIVKEVIEGPVDGARRPAQLIRPANGTLRWYLDDDSAALLTTRSPG